MILKAGDLADYCLFSALLMNVAATTPSATPIAITIIPFILKVF